MCSHVQKISFSRQKAFIHYYVKHVNYENTFKNLTSNITVTKHLYFPVNPLFFIVEHIELECT